MKTKELDYYLPPGLIAQQPAEVRSDSRLLVLNRTDNVLTDSRFEKVGQFLLPGDCLVLNDTKVLPARFFGKRGSGAKLEGLFLKENQHRVWEVMLKGLRRIKTGETIFLNSKTPQQSQDIKAVLLEKTSGGRCLLKVETDSQTEAVLDKIGYPPLPPYIKRGTDSAVAAQDRLRYQTVYACKAGAVAAPTAGLHFTDKLIEQLKEQDVSFAYITLHVGAGTFLPVTAEILEEHEIHQEWYSLDEKNAGIINAARKKGRRIIAVGTTSVRTLETLATGQQVTAGSGKTDLFITPGYEFKMVDAMITNFHLPKSTLLALVAAFAGLDNTLAAYNHAIEQRYRFYSYGDAMLIY